MKFGRPPKYKKKYCKMIIEWFDVQPTQQIVKKEIITTTGVGDKAKSKVEREYITVPNKFPTIESFAWSIGVHDNTLENWANAKKKNGKSKYPEFLCAYTRAKQLQKEFLMANGLGGTSPPQSFIFVAKNVVGMTDKQEVDHTSGGKPVSIGVISYAEAMKALPSKTNE